jgi:hypothetical protein
MSIFQKCFLRDAPHRFYMATLQTKCDIILPLKCQRQNHGATTRTLSAEGFMYKSNMHRSRYVLCTRLGRLHIWHQWLCTVYLSRAFMPFKSITRSFHKRKEPLDLLEDASYLQMWKSIQVVRWQLQVHLWNQKHVWVLVYACLCPSLRFASVISSGYVKQERVSDRPNHDSLCWRYKLNWWLSCFTLLTPKFYHRYSMELTDLVKTVKFALAIGRISKYFHSWVVYWDSNFGA